LTVVLY